jgi:hypothetical protein
MECQPIRRLRVHVARLPGVPVLPVAAAAIRASGAPDAPACDARIYGALEGVFRDSMEFVGTAACADVIVCAHDASTHRDAARAVTERLRRTARPIFYHSESDDLRPTAPVSGKVFRSSTLASRRRPHEEIATGCVPDLTAERSPHLPQWAGWSDRPTVGFIGHVAGGLRSITYLRRGWQHFHGFTLRERVLRRLEESDAVLPAFTRRGTNLGPPMAGTDGDALRRAMRQEYVDSVFANSYALCIRGAGNWSYRFFEALSAGRIPVLIDTDCALPLEQSVRWERHICRIPAADLHEAPRMIAAFHDQLGPVGHAEMQRRNRELWETRLCPERFFPDALAELAAFTAKVQAQPQASGHLHLARDLAD